MENNAATYHVPVLLKQSVDYLVTRPDGIYVDATFGGGGHSREIISRLDGDGRLYSFDQDQDAMANAIPDPRFTFVYGNFRYMKNFMRWYGHEKVNGILADLGVSWHHFDDSSRGFSFRFDGPIDMRMNQREGMTAADVLNDYPEEKLASLFYLYGELQSGRQLAKVIAGKRQNTRIETVSQLMETVRPVIGREREKKEMAKLFQALRMEVNHEVDALREMLESTIGLLEPGGRLVVITYHSIEDRMVKNLMKSGNIEGDVKSDFYGRRLVPFRQVCKPVIPDNDEQTTNPRSRSAKLRVAEIPED
ncbi:MAG: 16S rRNA (cytosine(1402)-N(4))-methyltransferase RsmH [Bacteroidaceae bacterium]|nr:16S rRNA (cytosine(1402)-N(4))-methyltransferase RsmH [Bacteroidaceae bacterium]